MCVYVLMHFFEAHKKNMRTQHTNTEFSTRAKGLFSIHMGFRRYFRFSLSFSLLCGAASNMRCTHCTETYACIHTNTYTKQHKTTKYTKWNWYCSHIFFLLLLLLLPKKVKNFYWMWRTRIHTSRFPHVVLLWLFLADLVSAMCNHRIHIEETDTHMNFKCANWVRR